MRTARPRLWQNRRQLAGRLLPAMVFLLLGAGIQPAWCGPADSVAGVRVQIEVSELLDADPPEAAVIDTLAADLHFDLETTLRAGNFVLFLTATPKGAGSVRLQCALYPFGPATSPVFDDATVEYGVPLIIADIPGKGKSTYRALITPEPVRVQVGIAAPLSETGAWRRQYGTYYLHYAAPYSLADFHFPQLHSIIDGEFGAMRDTFALRAPGRVTVFAIEGSSDEFPYDPRFDFAVDPARNRVAARYDNVASGLDAQALLLLSLYRWWGYAPDLLAVGASAYVSFADFDVREDRANGKGIPLDSLVRTRDFKRHDPAVARHHAASFVGWLIRTRGMNAFRGSYERATDLSLERALWAGYQKTLAELEAEWLDYLNARRFTVVEFHQFATQARYYRRGMRHLALLERAAAVSDSIVPGIWYDLALAQGHTGLWDDAANTLQDLVVARPDFMRARVLLGEAFWAQGDRVYATLALNAALDLDSTLAQAYLRLGDMQDDLRRADSAAVLWRRGLAAGGGAIVTSELHLRLGQFERRRGNMKEASLHFHTALATADQAADENAADPTIWLLIGAAYLELDSLELAQDHLEAARYLADAPVDAAQIHILMGACHDRAGRRLEALHEYEQVFTMPAPYIDQETARRYINRPYRSDEPQPGAQKH